jgi:hypothetical protein
VATHLIVAHVTLPAIGGMPNAITQRLPDGVKADAANAVEIMLDLTIGVDLLGIPVGFANRDIVRRLPPARNAGAGVGDDDVSKRIHDSWRWSITRRERNRQQNCASAMMPQGEVHCSCRPHHVQGIHVCWKVCASARVHPLKGGLGFASNLSWNTFVVVRMGPCPFIDV